MRQVTLEDVKSLQSETGEGVMWCKSKLRREYAIEAVINLPPTGNLEFDQGIKNILMYVLGEFK